MRKGIKVSIGALVLVVVLVLVYIVLIIKGILPNPFLDTSDLVCTRTIEFETYSEEEKVVFKFDKWANLEKYEMSLNVIYPTFEEAKEYYEHNKQYVESLKFIEEENKIVFSNDIFKNKDDEYHFNKTKQELKEEYEKNHSYKCE